MDAADSSFDGVACAFGILHFADPDRGMAEACRVLKSGGRYGFTVWLGPDKGSEMMRLIGGTMRKHANLDIGLPEAPPMFKYADPEVAKAALAAAGFANPAFRQLDLEWSCDAPEDVLAMIYKSIVRTPMVLERQTEEVRENHPRRNPRESRRLSPRRQDPPGLPGRALHGGETLIARP